MNRQMLTSTEITNLKCDDCGGAEFKPYNAATGLMVCDDCGQFKQFPPSTEAAGTEATARPWRISKTKNDVSVSGMRVDTLEIESDASAEWIAQVLGRGNAELVIAAVDGMDADKKRVAELESAIQNALAVGQVVGDSKDRLRAALAKGNE